VINHAAVAHHGDGVGDALELMQAVGDVDRRHVMLAQVGDTGEQEFGLAFGQARGRLVEDQQLHALRHRTGDADQLLLMRAQIVHARQRRDRQAEYPQPVRRVGP
jgi:hypothetical protein